MYKVQSNCHQQHTETQLFAGWMPVPVAQSTMLFHGLAHSKLTWGSSSLVLTTKGSWLLWGRVAKQSYISFIALWA